jgi:hypothetical protein
LKLRVYPRLSGVRSKMVVPVVDREGAPQARGRARTL